MRDVLEIFSGVLTHLEDEKIPYMIVGSVACAIYGDPRLTHDLDLVIDIPASRAADLTNSFKATEFYIPPINVIQEEINSRGQFNLIHLQSGYKIDIVIRKPNAHGIAEFERRKKVEFWPGLKAEVASPEDVIIKKLQFYKDGGSEKHLRDIAGILRNTPIDAQYIESWISQLELKQEWLAAQQK